jgi:hypothetical protein
VIGIAGIESGAQEGGGASGARPLGIARALEPVELAERPAISAHRAANR